MRGGVIAIALLGLGCETRGVEVVSWAMEATSGGVPMSEGVEAQTGVVVAGNGTRLDEGTFVITEAVRTDVNPPAPIPNVAVTFHARDGVAFPDYQGPVVLDLLLDPGHVGASLEPSPVVSLVLWEVEGKDQPVQRPVFWLSESTLVAEGTRTAVVPNILSAFEAPSLQVTEQWIEYEPDECGMVYYDDLVAIGETTETLRRGESRRVVAIADDPAIPGDGTIAWQVRHETSWHRVGACEGQAVAFAQTAAWRETPP